MRSDQDSEAGTKIVAVGGYQHIATVTRASDV